MHATMLPFSYTLSCGAPFVDVNTTDSVSSASPSGTPSPPAVSYIGRCYENVLAGSRAFLPPEYHHNFLRKANSSPDVSPKPPRQTSDLTYARGGSCRKKSFTIEAILGLNSFSDDEHRGRPNQKSDDERVGPTRSSWVSSRRQERLISPHPYVVPSATPRSALTAVSTLLSAVTTTQASQSPTKENKLKPHSGGGLGESLGRKNESENLSSGSSGSSCSRSSSSAQKSAVSSAKTKRIRTIFTPEQLERLETEFERQQYMVGPERLYLASALSLTEAQVKVWFQNRRIKYRKQHLEMQQARLAQLREADNTQGEGSNEPPVLTEEMSHPTYEDVPEERK